MTDAFEKWINSFSDEEYEEMLDEDNPNGFTDAQQEKALNIREPPTKEEIEDLEKEQEFIEEPEEIEEPIKEEKPFRVGKLVRPEVSEPVIESATVVTPSGFQPIPQPTPTPVIRPQPPKPRAVVQAVRTAVVSAGRFIRRFFRV